MIDLMTREGALRFTELRRAEMVRCFERIGRFEANGYATCAHVFVTHEVRPPSDGGADPDAWSTGPRLATAEAVLVTVPRVLSAMIPPPQLGAIFGETVRRYATLGRAVGVVLMSEQWWGKTQTLEEREALPARVSEWSERREVLYVKLEHQRVGIRGWYAEIKRDTDPPARLDEWRDAGMWIGGNLGGFLSTVAS